jgi:hypothetical protein
MINPTTIYGVAMAQVTTGEIAGFVTVFMGAGWSLTFWLGKMMVKEIRGDIKELIDKIAILQVEVPKTYVTKHDCEIMIGRQLGCNFYQGQPKTEKQ